MKLILLLTTLFLISCSDNNVEPEVDLALEIEEISSNIGTVNTVSISADGSSIAWGGNNNDIKIKGEPSLKGHIGWINSIDLVQDGSLLLSGSGDNNIKLWDVKKTLLLRTFSEHITNTWDVKFTPDEKSVLSAEGNYIVLWHDAVDGFITRRPFYGHTSRVNSVDMSYDMSTIVSGSSDKTIKIWDADTGELIRTLEEHTGSVKEVEFSPISLRFASCSSDQTVKIWSIDSLQSIMSLEGHEGSIYSISYHPSGKYLAGGGSSKIVYIWDLVSGEIIRKLEGHSKTIKSVDFGGKGNIIVSGGSDDKIIIWRNVFASQQE